MIVALPELFSYPFLIPFDSFLRILNILFVIFFKTIDGELADPATAVCCLLSVLDCVVPCVKYHSEYITRPAEISIDRPYG